VALFVLIVCVSASQRFNTPGLNLLKKAVDKHLQGKVFATLATCNTTAALGAVVSDAVLVQCLYSLPNVYGTLPNCFAPNQTSYAAYCSKCSDAIPKAVGLIDKYGCTFADVAMAMPADCQTNDDCDMGMMCGGSGSCGAACNMTMWCMNCDETCGMDGVCAPVSMASSMMSLPNDVLAYEGSVICSKNSDGKYCQPIANSMEMPTCADFESAGCCPGLLVATSIACEDPDQDSLDMFAMWKSNCTKVDWTATCGLTKPSDCCGKTPAVICGASGGGGGGAASALAPAIFTFALLLVKFFY